MKFPKKPSGIVNIQIFFSHSFEVKDMQLNLTNVSPFVYPPLNISLSKLFYSCSLQSCFSYQQQIKMQILN